MYLIKRIIVFVFLVITINAAYSQKKKSNCRASSYSEKFFGSDFSKDFLVDTTLYIYIDSSIVNGLTVYTDSIKVVVSTKDTQDDCILQGALLRGNQVIFYKIYYPIPLVDNPLFKKAIYRDDDCGLMYLAPYKEYVILSSDGRHINYAFSKKMNGDLSAKYDPLNNNNSGTVMTIKRKKLWYWITQEMNKDEVVSIAKKGNVYIVKSFSN